MAETFFNYSANRARSGNAGGSGNTIRRWAPSWQAQTSHENTIGAMTAPIAYPGLVKFR
jgi:hypothetical protein